MKDQLLVEGGKWNYFQTVNERREKRRFEKVGKKMFKENVLEKKEKK